MTFKAKQQGMTLMGFMMVLAIVGIFAFVAMKLFPVYSEYYAVVADMKAVQAEPGIANKSPQSVKASLFRRFEISYVSSVKDKDIKITRNNGYNLQIAYEVRKPLAYNLDFVAKFDKTVDLTRQGGD